MDTFQPIEFTVTLNKKFVRRIVDNHIDELRYVRSKIMKKLGIKVNDIAAQMMSNQAFADEVKAQAMKIAFEALDEAVGEGQFVLTAAATAPLLEAEDRIRIEELRVADEEMLAAKPDPHVLSAIEFIKKHGYEVSKK